MPTLDDIPILAAASSTGDDLIPVYDLTATGSSKVRKLALNAVLGLTPTGDISTTAVSATAATRVLTVTGTTSTITLPAASGVLREVIVINGGSGAVTMSALAAGSATVANATSARFLSNGTGWYRVG